MLWLCAGDCGSVEFQRKVPIKETRLFTFLLFYNAHAYTLSHLHNCMLCRHLHTHSPRRRAARFKGGERGKGEAAPRGAARARSRKAQADRFAHLAANRALSRDPGSGQPPRAARTGANVATSGERRIGRRIHADAARPLLLLGLGLVRAQVLHHDAQRGLQANGLRGNGRRNGLRGNGRRNGLRGNGRRNGLRGNGRGPQWPQGVV